MKNELSPPLDNPNESSAQGPDQTRVTQPDPTFNPDVLANLSHEIRTPLSGIVGAVELLRHTLLDREQRSHLETIQTSGDLLLSIVNNVLDFSKIEAGRLSLEHIPFDLRTTVEEAVYLAAGNAHQKGLDLACLVARDVPDWVSGDPRRLQQILLNLVGNAVKFTERGEVIVRVEAAAANGRPGIRCVVSDTGIGIPADRQAMVFEPFVQADSSTSRRFGGSGLGLAISRRLTKAMGGTLECRSSLGRGSEFWFALPFDPVPDADVRGAWPNIAGLRALVVDDHVVTCKFFGEQLGRLGIEVYCASMLDQVHEIAESALGGGGQFDLLFIDFALPEPGGIAMAQRLRSLDSLEGARVVLLSPVTTRDEVAAACANGAASYLIKPIREQALRDLLSELFAGRAAEQTQPPAAPQRTAPSTPTLSGPILLVEDNMINRQVVEGMLRILGQRVVSVDAGADAVEACLGGDYSLVLMDWQMPGMDGLEATRQIRSQEPAGHHTPIVALTANALDGDRARCLDAGMDDYLAKPLTLDKLAQVLNAVAAVKGVAVAPPPKSAESRRPAPEGLPERLARLRRALPADQAEPLLRAFLEQTPAVIEGFTEALRGEDYASIASGGHFLKGSCAHFGSDAMVRACTELQAVTPATPAEEISRCVARLGDEFARVEEFLGAECGTP